MEQSRRNKKTIAKSSSDLDFEDNLEITYISDMREWEKEEMSSMKKINIEQLNEIDDSLIITCEIDIETIKKEKFFMIGTSYSDSIYIDLTNPKSKSHGAIYNSAFPYPYFLIYKIADNYHEFLTNIEKSLITKVSKQL